MEERIKKILNREIVDDFQDKNIQMNIPLSVKNKNIEENVITKIVSTNDQFEKERNESGKYRLYGNIKSIISNVLINDNVKIFRKDGVTKDRYSNKNDITERNGWIGYIDNDSDTAQTYQTSNTDYGDNKSSLCEFIPFDPGYDRLKFDDPDGKPNYMLRVSYPYSSVDITLVRNENGVTLADGISFISVSEYVIGEISYTVFTTPINHGLSVGSFVRLFDIGEFSNETYKVTQLGNENGDNINRCFIVGLDYSKIDFSKGTSRFAREVDGVLSEYYVRKYKTITDGFKDYDRYPAAFSQSYFGDEEVAFNFTKDVDVSGLVDNLGRPLSELYLSIIKVDTDSN
jgi:hypothetical protein